MRCPYCKTDHDRVVDTRTVEGGTVVRRRRVCESCDRRFTTYERIEGTTRLRVIKKDGTAVPYDRSKILDGLDRACYKRPVTQEQLRSIVEATEEEIFRAHDREVSSRFIGQQLAKHLRDIDQIAYVRFASVYREFKDVGDFIDEAQQVIEHHDRFTPGQQTLFDDQS